MIDIEKLAGTKFQKRVWKELIKIPYGKTITYGELARRIRRPKAARAVGNACGKNPIPIIIPCHRVVGSDGKLGGFSGGLWRKKWLLKLEQKRGQATFYTSSESLAKSRSCSRQARTVKK